MKKRLVLAVTILSLAALLLVPTAQAGGFSQSVSGGFTDTAIDTNGDGMAANVFTGGTQGTGGTAAYDGVVEIQFAPPSGLCPGGEIEGVIVAYSIVRRYNNGSLMYSSLDSGHACFNPGTGTATIHVEASIDGGTGMFSNASGAYALDLSVVGLLPDAGGGLAHAAFSGTATGTLD